MSHRKEDARMPTLVLDMTCQSVNAADVITSSGKGWKNKLISLNINGNQASTLL